VSAAVIQRVVFRGRVQGVGFRDFVERQAEHNAIGGWVRNRRDGSVEAVFSGPPDRAAAMIAACRRGPRSAAVESVDVTAAGEAELALCPAGTEFVMLPTV
jgi:acylphosphatase